MAKEINALDLRKRFGEIMDEVRYRKEPYIVKRNGRAVMVLLDIEAYEASRSNIQDETFIEEYSNERITDFLAEDKLTPDLKEKSTKLLHS